jgi:dipeptidyl aminopeptidase/acylaminoacyl peptidase
MHGTVPPPPPIVTATIPAVTPATQTHPFTVHDLLAMRRISDPQVSPDGRRVVFVVSRTDLERNRRRTSLWLMGADGGGVRPLTGEEGGASNPRWSPDGKSVWFLSSRADSSSQVWRIPVDGGEAEPVTKLPLEVNALVPAPDGQRLVVAMEVFPGASVEDTKKRLDETEKRAKEGPTGRIYDGGFVRHWDTWSDGRRSHLFVIAAGGGEPVDLMKDMDADAPSKPFGGPEEVAWSADGKFVVFSARDAGGEEAWSTNFDLWAAPADGSAPPRNLTAENPAWDTSPSFSPDGRTLAYKAMKVPGYEADRLRIVLRAWPDGPARVLTEGWDFSAGALTWSADGKTIYTEAANVGQVSLFAIDVATGKARLVVDQGLAGPPALAGGRLLYTHEYLKSPAELWSVKPDGSDARVLTHLNDEAVAAARMGDYEQYSFTGAGGDKVYGYIVKPVDFEAGKKYPVAFLIHGGPQGSFGNDFHYRWNPQTYAGAGYAVVMVDFHGSTGYGQAFCDAIQGDWGGKPFEDLKAGLAAALERYPWMDGDRVAALGASFGAYMVNWIAGQWPDRFRCLVSHDGNLDERAAYFETEELWFPERDHMGTPWTNPESYEKHNPVNFVKNWKTPMLVVHGGRDFRIAETEGMGTFTALQRLGIPSRFLYFPDENHWVLKPRNSILWHETVLAWLDQWTKP